MKKIIFTIISLLITLSVSMCSSEEGDTIKFINDSTYTVYVNHSENAPEQNWKEFSLQPDEDKEVEYDDSSIYWTHTPGEDVDITLSGNKVIFTDMEIGSD